MISILNIAAAGANSKYEMWKIFFSNMSLSVIFSPHNFNLEVIQNIAELYSPTDLKFCKLK
jgi:hypothetical protein